jgi:hypothetical protein
VGTGGMCVKIGWKIVVPGVVRRAHAPGLSK